LDGTAVDIRCLALRGSFAAIAALAPATAVVSRLFSILRSNPPTSIEGLNSQDLDLLVATGPACRALSFWVGFWALLCSSNLSLNPLRPANVMPYGGLMLAARMTLPHFLVSSEMSFAKSPGEPASTAP
jgi:hypothetical protein